MRPLLILVALSPALAQSDAARLAHEAYIFGYPLAIMDPGGLFPIRYRAFCRAVPCHRFRALVARRGLGANLAEDAIYPQAQADADGHAFGAGSGWLGKFGPCA